MALYVAAATSRVVLVVPRGGVCSAAQAALPLGEPAIKIKSSMLYKRRRQTIKLGGRAEHARNALRHPAAATRARAQSRRRRARADGVRRGGWWWWWQ
jgi:hypothetical protein